MILQPPFKISARLLPALQIGSAWVQLEYSPIAGAAGRTRYRWTIDFDGQEFSGDDLQSGCGNGSLQSGFESLLSFLGAAGEAYAYRLRTNREAENEDLFPPAVVEWAHQNSDEICMAKLTVQETENLIEEAK
jgi:hypothetical protein